jgi:hypothetical protein
MDRADSTILLANCGDTRVEYLRLAQCRALQGYGVDSRDTTDFPDLAPFEEVYRLQLPDHGALENDLSTA